MADKTREVGVRLSVKDADVAQRALQAFGAEGEQALKHIQAAATTANPSLVLLSNGIQRSKEYAAEFAIEGARSFLGPIVAIGSATAAVDLLRGAMEKVKDLGDQFSLAERLGLSIDQLNGLQLAFREAGGNVDDLNTALQTFDANLAKPNSPLQQLFKINGIKISGDTLTDLKSFSNLVKNAANEQARLQVVTEGMGRGSKEVLDLLIGDLGATADRTKDLGMSLNDIDPEQIKKTNEQLADMNARLDDAKTRLSLIAEPEVLFFFDTLTKSLQDFNYVLKQINDGNYGEALKSVVGEGFDAGARLRVVERQLKMGTADVDTSLKTPKQVNDFYASFGDAIQQPVNIVVGGGKTTKLPDTAATDAANAIKKVKDALQLQITNLTETNRQQAINNALAQAHITLADKDGPAIANLAGELYDQKKAIDDVNQATSFMAQTGEQGFESLIDGTKSWQDALGDIVTTLEKVVLQAALLGSGPLAGILGTSPATSGQTGGAFGWLASLFTTKSANGNVFTGLSGLGAYANSVVHKPTMFAFANGVGLMGEEPGSPGEAVMPLKRDSQGRLGVAGGGSVQVNLQVINNAGVSVTAEQSRDPSGGVNLKLMVEKIAATSLATPGAPLHRAARTAFGLVPQTTRRGA